MEAFLVNHPEVIPSEQINKDDPPSFLVVRSQAGVTLGSLDILLLDHNAVPTVLEAKLADNREIRRSVLAQAIEYAAHLCSEWTADEFIEAGREFWKQRGKSFDAEAEKRLGFELDSEYQDRVAANLASDRVRVIIAADAIPSVLQRSIEFLNDITSASFEIYGLEVSLFAADESNDRFLSPRLIGMSERAKSTKSGQKGSRWNEDRFFDELAEIAPASLVELAASLMAFGGEVSKRNVEWGTGTERGSLTARLVADHKRFSLFSVYTTSHVSLNFGWNNAVSDEMSERYLDLANDRLGTRFDLKTWKDSYPMVPLEDLESDNAQELKEIVKQFVAEVRGGVAARDGK